MLCFRLVGCFVVVFCLFLLRGVRGVTPFTSPHRTGFLCQRCLNCFTHFTHFSCLVSVYQPSHLYCIHDTCVFSSFPAADFCLISLFPVFVCITALFYIPLLSLSLRGHLQTQHVWCVLCPVSEEDGILGAEVSYRLWSVGSNVLLFSFSFFGLDFSKLRGWVGQPNQSAGCVLP